MIKSIKKKIKKKIYDFHSFNNFLFKKNIFLYYIYLLKFFIIYLFQNL